jgi:hypothetical protein
MWLSALIVAIVLCSSRAEEQEAEESNREGKREFSK